MLPRSRRLAIAALLALAASLAGADCTPARASADRLQALVEAEATARDALATIRRGAQDWKNLLLRGSDPAQQQALQARFDAQASGYEARLAQLRGQLAPQAAALDRVQSLENERVALFARYRAALARHGTASLESAAAADREVQGADVTSFRTLEQLVDTLADQRTDGFRELRAAIERCTG